MLKIGDFSRLARVSVKTLRHYAQLGLLEPAWIDRFTGYRYYTIDQLHQLNRILALKDLGFSLQQIRKLLQADLAPDELKSLYSLKQAELASHIEKAQARLRRIETHIRMIEDRRDQGGYDVILQPVQAMSVVGFRGSIDTVKCTADQIAELYTRTRANQADFYPPKVILAIYYDLEYRDNSADVEIAVLDEKFIPLRSDLLRHELPAVAEMACAIHREGTAEISNAYHALMVWMEANGFQARGPLRELYYYDADLTSEITERIIEIQIPVEKKVVPQKLIRLKEKFMMQPKFVTKPAITAVGMLYFGKNENGEIAQMWQEFTPRIQEIQNIVDGAFGLCTPVDDSGRFHYLASMAVSDASDIPSGMQVWHLPEREYAVFSCTLPTIGETYKYIFETWIPESEYEYTGDPDFEYYDENFDPQSQEGELFIYIPVRRKAIG